MTDDILATIDEWGPEKVVIVSHRKTGMRGVLVIDNSSRGTGKGGTRMSPTLSVTEVSRLARTMTWKWAAVDLFHGGAKAGILGDPNDPHKEDILRAFARALSNEVPREYVFGLDMGLRRARCRDFRGRTRRQRRSDWPAARAGWPAIRPARRHWIWRSRSGGRRSCLPGSAARGFASSDSRIWCGGTSRSDPLCRAGRRSRRGL